MEVIENLLAWLCPSAGGDVHPRGVVPIPWYADGLDFRRLGPFLDLSSDELWLGFAPDACCGLGFSDRLEVGTCPDWSDSDEKIGEFRIMHNWYTRWIRAHLLRAGKMCWNIETRRARLYDQEAF